MQLGPNLQLATLVMIVESILFIGIVIGWYFGARRMQFDLHHRAVYSIVLTHSITVGAWMIPRAISLTAEGLLDDLVGNWYQLVHDVVGILAVIFGIVLSLIFLTRSDMPLSLLKKTRPIMFMTLGLWVLAYALGVMAYAVQIF